MDCLAKDEERLVTRIMLDNMAKKDDACPGAASHICIL